VPECLREELAALVHASLSKGTWNKYASGWKAFEDFQDYTKERCRWPLGSNTIRAFATYLVRVKNLKPSSARSYLSAVYNLQKLKGFNSPKETEDSVLSAILKGATNLDLEKPVVPGTNCRRVVTLPILRHLGHRLAGSGWDQVATQSIWSAGLLAFFGTMRMGEILAPAEDWADPTSSLSWADIKYRQQSNSFLIHVKSPKMGTAEGEFVDIFPFKGLPGGCPVAALKKQKCLQEGIGRGRQQDPPFIYPSGMRKKSVLAKTSKEKKMQRVVFQQGKISTQIIGKYLTMSAYNQALKILLEDLVDDSRDKISCHSFRAGLPSLLNRFPDLATQEDIKGWGRWSSEAYTRYTRLKIEQKQKIFEKITAVLR